MKKKYHRKLQAIVDLKYMRIRTGMCVCAYKSRLHESFEILLPTQLPTEYGSIELNIVSPEIKTLFYFFIVFSGLW